MDNKPGFAGKDLVLFAQAGLIEAHSHLEVSKMSSLSDSDRLLHLEEAGRLATIGDFMVSEAIDALRKEQQEEEEPASATN